MKRSRITNKDVTLLAPDTKVEGSLKAQGDVMVYGTITGKLESAGNVVIGEQAKVQKQVQGILVQVAGEVLGKVEAQELAVRSTGKINGDIAASSLSIELGAIINGQCSMQKGEEKITVKSEEAPAVLKNRECPALASPVE